MQPISPRLLLIGGAAAALLCATPATAQWAWRDASGKMVFSDQAPPKSIADKNIVRRPEPASGPRYDTSGPAPSEAADATKTASTEAAKTAATISPPKSLVDREIESRRRQQQLAEAQKKAADEEQRKAQMAENCERLRSYQRALDDGLRIARVNPSGEREVLDDAARAAETDRTRAQIEQHCR
jgi:hypothetical protein